MFWFTDLVRARRTDFLLASGHFFFILRAVVLTTQGARCLC